MVGFLGRIIGGIGPVDRTWCCDRCRDVYVEAHSQRATGMHASGHAGRSADAQGRDDDERQLMRVKIET
jgi:hypothetical protein